MTQHIIMLALAMASLNLAIPGWQSYHSCLKSGVLDHIASHATVLFGLVGHTVCALLVGVVSLSNIVERLGQ